MNKVWITRTQPGADKTEKAVRELGFDPMVAPLLRTVPPEAMPSRPPASALLIFTSSNGVRAFCDLTDKRDWQVVTVGDATAELAKAFEFRDVKSASGTSVDVTRLVKSEFNPDTTVIHCAGDIVRGTIVEDLQGLGYKAERYVFYKTEIIGATPELKDIHYLLLHSPLAAQTLSKIRPDCTHITAICMSEAVRTALGTLPLREIFVANAPTETALLACLPR